MSYGGVWMQAPWNLGPDALRARAKSNLIPVPPDVIDSAIATVSGMMGKGWVAIPQMPVPANPSWGLAVAYNPADQTYDLFIYGPNLRPIHMQGQRTPAARTGVFAGLLRHQTGGLFPSTGDTMMDARSCGARWGMVLGAPAGFLLAKTLLAAHPFLWGAALWGIGGYLAVRGSSTTCTCFTGSPDGACWDDSQTWVTPDDTAARSGCKRKGFTSGAFGGAGIGALAGGSLLVGGIAAALVAGIIVLSARRANALDANTAPGTIAPGTSWSTNYKSRGVTIQNVDGAYLLTVYDAPTHGNAVLQGTYASAGDAWNAAVQAIDTGRTTIVSGAPRRPVPPRRPAPPRHPAPGRQPAPAAH